jgi:P27 family predicted phage terminase small subunit
LRKSNNRAPNGLSSEARALWRRVVAEYDLRDEAGLLLLRTALEAFGRMKEAQSIIKRDGPVVYDRFKQPKAHPLLTTERDSRAAMLHALKALNLDLEPLKGAPGRPGGT